MPEYDLDTRHIFSIVRNAWKSCNPANRTNATIVVLTDFRGVGYLGSHIIETRLIRVLC